MKENWLYIDAMHVIQWRRRQQYRLILLLIVGQIQLALPQIEARLYKTPRHDSALTGAAWVDELRNGHKSRMHHALRVDSATFE